MKPRSITRPPELTLFTDEDTGCLPHHRLPRTLLDAGLRVECFEQHFSREDEVEDWEWLSLCGKNRWLAVTHDRQIRFEEPSILAIAEHETQVLTLIGSWKHEELAINLVNSIYVVERHARKTAAPCILKLHMAAPHKRDRSRAGVVEVYKDRRTLLREAKRTVKKRG